MSDIQAPGLNPIPAASPGAGADADLRRGAAQRSADNVQASRWSPASAALRAGSLLKHCFDLALAQRLAGSVFLARVASAAIVYLYQVLLARWLGTYEFGIYVYVWTWVLLLGSLLDFGLATAAQRFVPEFSETKAFDRLRGFLSGSCWFTLAAAGLLSGLGAFGLWLIGAALDPYLLPLYLACLCLPLFALGGVQSGIARSYDWVHLSLLPPFILRPIIILALMFGAYAAGLATDASTAMIAAAAAIGLTVVIQGVTLHRRLKNVIPVGPRLYEVRHWLRVSMPIFMSGSFFFMLSYVDVLVLQYFRPPDEVALYYAATKTLSLVAFVNYSVASTTAHRFSEYHVNGDHARLHALVASAVRWTFWPSVAAIVVILALGQQFLWLFGKEFVTGYHLMPIICVGLLARSAVGPVERILNMLDGQRSCAAVYAAALVLNVVACIALIPRFGADGAAIAISVAMVLESALLFLVAKRRLGVHAFIWQRGR